MADKFKDTIDGGIKIGRASNLGQTIQHARTTLDQGKPVYVRKTSESHIVVKFTGLPAEAASYVYGDQRENPQWVQKALNIINS